MYTDNIKMNLEEYSCYVNFIGPSGWHLWIAMEVLGWSYFSMEQMTAVNLVKPENTLSLTLVRKFDSIMAYTRECW